VRFHLAPLAVALVVLSPNAVSASSIDLANTYLRSWNGVIVHRPGDEFSTFLLNEEVVTGGPEAVLANDLGFATLDAASRPLSLHPASAVDATAIDALGYDYVIAEASTWYEEDLTMSGGAGPVVILLEATQNEISFIDDAGSSIHGTRSIQIFDGPNPAYGMSSTAESDLVQLEYGVTYRIRIIFTAYSKATLGHLTSNERDLELSLSIVPECSDGIDNDDDSLIDFPADPGCFSAEASNESPACDDGIDNDNDTFIDFGVGGDPGCFAAWDDSEAGANSVCGLGFELALLLPPLLWLRGRRRRRL
jgi:hypothetical protein